MKLIPPGYYAGNEALNEPCPHCGAYPAAHLDRQKYCPRLPLELLPLVS